MATFQETETIVIKGTIKDESDVLVTPAVSTKITITDPLAVKVKENQDVTFDSTGVFRYVYTPTADPALGGYHVRITGIDTGPLKSITDSEFFLVG